MFNINDYVVYGSNGVCKVNDIKKETGMSGIEEEYYILVPVYNERMTIKTPVNNPRVLMREVLTKDEVTELIKIMAKNEVIDIEDIKRRNEAFRIGLKSGDSEDLIKIINSIKLEKKEKESLGKKLNKTEEDIMVNARKQLYQEFSIALDIEFDDVREYVLANI